MRPQNVCTILQREGINLALFNAQCVFQPPVHAACPHRGADETPLRSEYPGHFAQALLQIRHMIEHHIGNDQIKAVILEGDLLNIHLPERNIGQRRHIGHGRFHHARRKIRQGQGRILWQPFGSIVPHIARAAAQLQNPHTGLDVIVLHNPVSEGLLVGGIPLMQRNADVQFGGIIVLLAHDVRVVDVSHGVASFVSICLHSMITQGRQQEKRCHRIVTSLLSLPGFTPAADPPDTPPPAGFPAKHSRAAPYRRSKSSPPAPIHTPG